MIQQVLLINSNRPLEIDQENKYNPSNYIMLPPQKHYPIKKEQKNH